MVAAPQQLKSTQRTSLWTLKLHASIGIRLGEKSTLPEMQDKGRPTGLAISFFHQRTLSEKEKSLNMKAVSTYKKPAIIGQKLTNYKQLALRNTKKQIKSASGP